MKAVIMAGGEGTRLRPLSLGLPKPMVSILDKPALAYILGLLRDNGITEACLTLKYMPRAITDYIENNDFGIKLQTVTETAALGTAGGVKNCSDFIGGEDFLVISGDCVCDFDLKSLTAFHKSNDSEVTIALFEHPSPLEYGLVLTHADGRIDKFIEKPPWENVVTNKINTGIYVLSPSVLSEIPSDMPYDFGKELFPALLRKNRALYGLSMSGYWCDIGNPNAYLKCCSDILSGKTRLLHSEQTSGGVFSFSPIPDSVELIPPVYIGNGVHLKPGAKIGPHAVVGSGSSIASGASVSGCAIDSACILEDASVTGAVICKGAVIGRAASVREESVIGEGCIIGDNAVISQSVKIWPDRKIPPGEFIRDDITRGLLKGGLTFTSPGVISGDIGASLLTPAAALKLGETAGGLVKRAGLGWEGGDAARVIAEAIGCGISAAGAGLVRFDCGLPSCVSFAGASLMLPLSICVSQNANTVSIMFFGEGGEPLRHDMERKLLTESCAPPRTADGYGGTEYVGGVLELYASSAARYGEPDGGTPPTVAVIGGGDKNRALKRALSLLGCSVTGEHNDVPCFEAGGGGMSLYAVCEDGRRLSPEQLLVLSAAIELYRGRRELAVPQDAPEALDVLARRFGASVLRIGRDGARADKLYAQTPSLRDAVFMGALICGWMKQKGLTLSEMSDGIPRFSLVTKELRLRSGCGEVMAVLAAAACETGAELSGGVGLKLKDGFVRVSPLRSGDRLRIRGEGPREEIAEELCADIISRLKKIDDGFLC